MPQTKTYHRPTDTNEALALLSQSGVKVKVIGGGFYAVPFLQNIDEVVDLQDIGLAGITLNGDTLSLGAMTRLQTLVDDERLPDLLRQTAHRAGPNTLRSAATIGGVIATTHPESELLAALLVFEAQVNIQTNAGSKSMPLAEFLTDSAAALGGGLITGVTLAATGRTAAERVARTPADSPIVAAVARRSDDGPVHLALCGVAATPVLVDPAQVETAIDPPADFRGSSHYRRQMAAILSKRVTDKIA
jgi:putative selenate reductase FAD-binding subunit